MKTKRATVAADAFQNTTAYVRIGIGPRPAGGADRHGPGQPPLGQTYRAGGG
jgi:hypothetical protein